MKIRFQYTLAITLMLGAVGGAFAQKKNENIGTEVVNVVKPYTPTVSDAFKVKETPVIEDDENTQKEQIEYNIFSFPVASTFTPAKGRAAGVEPQKRDKLYNNYATLGIGNYGTVNAELFITENIDRNQYVGGMLRHLSSQGGIDGVVLDDKYYNTAIDLTYGNRQKRYSWNADLGYENRVYNWYGLPDGFSDEVIAGIDEQQGYNTITVGADITMEESLFFSDASIQYKRFWDGFDSAENRFILKPAFDLSVMDEKIKLDLVMDYVGATFNNAAIIEERTFNYFNLGAQPSVLFQRDDFSVSLGAGLFYSMGKANDENDNKFFVYPQVKASYKVVEGIVVAYAGAEGTLKQNSYEQFSTENPFISPMLSLAPTNQQYDIYVGLKGKLASNVSYNIKGSYMNEDDRAFFVHSNSTFDPAMDNEGFEYANSFSIFYGELRTISFFGELKADFSDKVSAGINASYFSYDTDQVEAWNLPELKASANLDVKITEKWSAGTNLFFVGERNDVVFVPTTDPLINTPEFITLKSFFDLNAHVGYQYNERLSGFLRLNNIANQDYERWVNYPVQGFQFMVGASYKFNL
ncbi:TonB-dependent receptor [Flavobacterium sp.]|uniref:TonB-dependent receptor n=1 Tax=Flavobacterium sp. TaxID=239 RepID=UPI00261AB012|nr:TonB-dependent receptor [Flavobacterium sp.]